jgi:hypothetical protein
MQFWLNFFTEKGHFAPGKRALAKTWGPGPPCPPGSYAPANEANMLVHLNRHQLIMRLSILIIGCRQNYLSVSGVLQNTRVVPQFMKDNYYYTLNIISNIIVNGLKQLVYQIYHSQLVYQIDYEYHLPRSWQDKPFSRATTAYFSNNNNLQGGGAIQW